MNARHSALALLLPAALAACGGSNATPETFEAAITSLATPVVPDMAAWQACRATAAAGARVDEDLALGQSLYVNGTPTFLVNGAPVVGQQPLATFRAAVDAALATAQASGLPRAAYYASSFPAIPVADDSPVRGPADAWVTIVEFSDLACPFCARVQPTLDQLRAAYPDDVRIVFRHFPLTRIHPFARPAAIAAECARAQGRFWEMHDAIFQAQDVLF